MGLFQYDELQRGLTGLGSSDPQLEAVRLEAQLACTDPASTECSAAQAKLTVWEAEFAKAQGATSAAPAPAPRKSLMERWKELKDAISPPPPPPPAPVVLPAAPAPAPAPPVEPQVVVVPAAAAGGGAVAAVALAIGVYLLLGRK